MSTQITAEIVASMAAGSAVFGGGGGGDPALGELMAAHAVSEYGPVDLIDLDDLDDDSLIVPIAFIGAPTVIQEKIPNGIEGKLILETMQELLGRPVGAFMSAELGGLNGVIPVAWCARHGIPLADADLMGRAFPELQMVTPTIFDREISPVVLVDERGNVGVFRTETNEWAEKLVRSVTVAMGGSASLGLYPMTAAVAREVSVRGSISRSIEVGRALLDSPDDPLDALAGSTGAVKLIEGKLIDVERRTEAGWASGTAIVEGTGPDAGSVLRVEFQNENLVAIRDGEPAATVPDIITLVDIHTGRPVVTEILRYGQRVAAVALPCDPVWQTPRGLELVGPRRFGYDIDYVPVGEQR